MNRTSMADEKGFLFFIWIVPQLRFLFCVFLSREECWGLVHERLFGAKITPQSIEGAGKWIVPALGVMALTLNNLGVIIMYSFV